jgi:two-component system cell cycle response regulator
MKNRGDDDESAAFAKALEGALAQTATAMVAEAPPAALALVVINGPLLGRVFALRGPGPLTLGRRPTCDFVVEADGVARQHLVIMATVDGWMLEDSNTTSGTFVNGKRCKRTVLKVHDKIFVGSSTIIAVRSVDDIAVPPETALDALTGLLNKRAFAARFEAAFHDALATKAPLTLALSNLDWFARLNDELGHLAGDAALRAVARHARESLPPACVIARYSGDGIAMFMPRTALVEARAILEPMRAAVGPMNPFVHEGRRFTLSLSIGLACVPDATVETPTPKALVKRADEQLYDAKRNGRDRMRPIV